MEECELLGEVREEKHISRKKRQKGPWSYWNGSKFVGSFRTKKLALAARKEMLISEKK